MARLPNPGGDDGQWGNILNDFLSQVHTGAGDIKAGAVGAGHLADASVTAPKLATTGAPSNGQVLSYNGTALAWTAPSGGGGGAVSSVNTYTGDVVITKSDVGLGNVDNTTDANKPISGATQTALNAKADSSALAAKADDSAVVHNTGNESITGTKNFTGTLQTGGQAVVATNDARLSDQRVPTNGSVGSAKLDVSGAPTNGQLLSYNGSNFTWVAAPTGGGDPIMGGDISGNASSATIVANAVTTAKIADNNITEPKLAASNTPSSGEVLGWNGSALTWVAQSGGGGDPAVGGDLSGTASNAQIVAGAVGATELATNAVTTIKITDANVTTAKIADANVTTAKIADDNVTTAKIADNNITEPKLAASNTPSSGEVLGWNGSALTWVAQSGGGGGGFTVAAVSANYTAASMEIVICDVTSGAIIVTLPAPVSGGQVKVKRKPTGSVNSIMVVPASGSIDSAPNVTVNGSGGGLYEATDFFSDGTQWYVG
jgi:hypothetical protein